MDRRAKEQIVAELHEKLKDFKLAVLTHYAGLDVDRMTTLRNALRQSGTEFIVAKNTLLRIASKDTDLAAIESQFKGPTAIAINRGDIVAPTKVLIEFAKKNEQLDIRSGMLDGKPVTKAQLGMLADLPSREVLLGQLLSVMVAAQTSLVTVLSAVPRGLVQVLDAYRVKKESEN
ncbi:MAG: 50S ribosomal protein L10 [Smithellaceae bacterium]|nr:50S ribosomal protein L10 [Smithellaceae bacterium]